MTEFISNTQLAITIIKIKNCVFNMTYTTTTEFNYIKIRLQEEFNKKRIDKIITSECFEFGIKNNDGIITLTDNISNSFLVLSVDSLSEYIDNIVDLIIEYAQYDLNNQKEKQEAFKNNKILFKNKIINT